MTVDWDDRRENMIDTETLRTEAERVVSAVLEADRLTDKINVGVALVDDAEIREINRNFRQVDAATDVLSFPMTDYDISQTVKVGDVDPASGELLLGDIVISVERAKEQAQEYGHSFEREFAFLLTHGMLHLIGYDHEQEVDARVMRAMEEEILGSLGLRRDAKEAIVDG